MVPEERTRQVNYTVCVPEEKTMTREVTDYRTVQKEKSRIYTVQVPYAIQKEVGHRRTMAPHDVVVVQI